MRSYQFEMSSTGVTLMRSLVRIDYFVQNAETCERLCDLISLFLKNLLQWFLFYYIICFNIKISLRFPPRVNLHVLHNSGTK
jgi:hypothetical protein